MAVVDKILNSLVRYLQKKQKQRKKSKKKKKRTARKPAKPRKKARPKTRPKKPMRSAKRFTRKKTAKPKAKACPAKKKKPKKTKPVAAKAPAAAKAARLGVVTHYFSRIGVIVLKMTAGTLSVGERIHIKGRKTDFIQKVKSLQIESVDVKNVKKGQLAGLKVDKVAKTGDQVYKAQ